MKYELTIIAKCKIGNTIFNLFPQKEITVTLEGKKRLPYPVQDFKRAYYYYIKVDLPNKDDATALCNKLNINQWVLRFLLVKADERS